MALTKPYSGWLLVLIEVGEEKFLLNHEIEKGVMIAPEVPSRLGEMSLRSLLQASVSLSFLTGGFVSSYGFLNFGELGKLSLKQKFALLSILWMGFSSPTGLVRN